MQTRILSAFVVGVLLLTSVLATEPPSVDADAGFEFELKAAVPADVGNSVAPALIVRCREGSFELLLSTEKVAQSEAPRARVSVSFDEGGPGEHTLTRDPLGRGFVFPDPERVLSRALQSERLDLDVLAPGSLSDEATFQLLDLAGHLETQDACPIPDASGGASDPLLAGVGGVSNPVLITETKSNPAYPHQAREAKVSGSVILKAVIDEGGIVRRAEVLRSSRPGYGFEESAILAVKRWRYRPALLNGEPVKVYFTVFVEFKARGKPKKKRKKKR
ncbi:MAG: energy transducer TonB [bacterium]|nr:energy transducer TonB [bacterium]